MTSDHSAPNLDELRSDLTPKQQRAAEMYVSGPPAVLGSKVNAYSQAYNWNGSRRGAQVKASALYARPDVAAYVHALRAAGAAASVRRLREWSELAVDAQETLHRASTGQLPHDLSDEGLRSAVRAAMYVVDRAYGTPSQQIELKQTGGITIEVAGPETLGRVVAATSRVLASGAPDGDQGEGTELERGPAGGQNGTTSSTSSEQGPAGERGDEYGAIPDPQGPHPLTVTTRK